MKTAIIVFCSLLFINIGIAQTITKTNSITITYLANEGFLLTGGDKKILIDGVFTNGSSTSQKTA